MANDVLTRDDKANVTVDPPCTTDAVSAPDTPVQANGRNTTKMLVDVKEELGLVKRTRSGRCFGEPLANERAAEGGQGAVSLRSAHRRNACDRTCLLFATKTILREKGVSDPQVEAKIDGINPEDRAPSVDDVDRMLIENRLLLRNVNKEYTKHGARPQFYILNANDALLVNWCIHDHGRLKSCHHSTICDGKILHDSPTSLLIEDRDRENN